jgi:ABC-type branched-subunit amino acid transport system substrate-binding protein
MRRHSAVLSAVLTVAMAAACGSTVQQVGSAGQQNPEAGGSLGAPVGNAPGASVAGPGTANPSPGTPAPTASGGSASSAPVGSTPAGDGPSSAVGAPGSRSARPATVPGTTDTTVKLGVEYYDTSQVASAGSGLGVKGAGATSQLKAFQFAVDYVNSHGGVAGGRKLVIVAHQASLSNSTATQAQATCTAFTDDNRVFAATADLSLGSPLVPCLAKHGVLSVNGGVMESGSRDDFLRYKGLYVGPAAIETVSSADAYVEALVRQGFLTKGSTIGLLWLDFADYAAARKSGLLPALARHGLKLKIEFQSHYSGPSDVGRVAGEMQNAVLQFRTANVDRVLTLDYGGSLTYFFMQNAQNQGYQPRYGLNSGSNLAFLEANNMAAQLSGATGIGWLAASDVTAQRQPRTAALLQCLALMKAHGMPAQTTVDYGFQYRACTSVFFLKSLLDRAPSLSPEGLRTALDALGRQPSYSGFGDTFSAQRPWGAALYRDLVFDSACTCASYRGPDRSFP